MPERRWSRSLSLGLIVSCVELFFALYHPPYHYPDELSHVQHAVFLRDEQRLPDPYLESVKVQPVIDQLHAAAGGTQRLEVFAVRCRAGDRPVAVGKLLALFPHRRCPDVLGVCRAGPGQPREQARVSRHRRRRMQKMCMQ
ncbi:MAG: hypothetical protein ACE5F1_12370, partial [Planctomycetota bacterium]